MVRYSSKFLAVVAVVAVVAMAAQMAVAQKEKGGRPGRGGREGGPGGPGGPVPMTRLAMVDTVQDALKLSDEQKEEIKSINEETRDAMDAMRKELDNGGRPDREKMRKVMNEASDKLSKVLDADQQKRLIGIFVQVAGPGAVMDPAVAKELNITDEQRDELRKAMGGMREGRGEARGRAKGEGKREGKRDQGSFREGREKMDKAVMAVLTSEQQKKLEELKGEKVDIDMSKLRGPGGGGRPDRERGKRGEAKERKSS